MRLIHAVTASDLQNSGHPYDAAWSAWRRVGKLPIFMHTQYGGRCYPDPRGLRFNGSAVYFSLPIGRSMQFMKEGEVVGCGQFLSPSTGEGLYNGDRTFLRASSAAGEENLFLWSDVYGPASGLASYIEYTCSYDLKTWSLYVNGKFIKSVQSTLNHDRKTLNMYFHAASLVGVWCYLTDIYVGFFDPSKEKPYLGRWACTALSSGASDFPNSATDDGVVDKLGIAAKTIEFTYDGEQKLKAVTLVGSMVGNFNEVLETTLTSGSDENLTTMSDSPTPLVVESWVGLGIGLSQPIGSVNFDNTSKKVTASLKLKP